MTSWQTCAISAITVRYQPVRAGLFFTDVLIQRWEAKLVDSSGSRVIFASEEYQTSISPGMISKNIEKESKIREAAYQKLIAQLLSDGWEPMTTDEYGWITLMKRKLAAPNSDGPITMPGQDIEHNRNIQHKLSKSAQMPVSFEQPKKSNTRLINVIIVVVLACSWCIISNIIWQYGDRIIQILGF